MVRHLLGVSARVEAGLGVPVSTATDRRGEIDRLFRQFSPELGRYLVAMVRDRNLAEDLLQETFTDALRAGGQLAEVRNPRAWLYALARNRALRSFRGARRFRSALDRLGSDGQSGGEGDEEVAAIHDLLLRELTPELRALVLLRYLHGFEAVELAEMTGLSADAIRQRLARATRRLLAAAQPAEGGEQR